MTVKIHHASVKLAAKLGYTFGMDTDGTTVNLIDKAGQIVSSGSTGREALSKVLSQSTTREVMDKLKSSKPRKARKARKARRTGDEDGEESEEDGEDGEDDEGKSVIKRKYKTKYRPHKMTCGDTITKQVRSEFMTLKDPDTKKPRLDWSRFTQFAKVNDCWSDEYRKLNKGMRRMNVVNRLRARIKDGHKVVWAV